jgi:hypothetical protein
MTLITISEIRNDVRIIILVFILKKFFFNFSKIFFSKKYGAYIGLAYYSKVTYKFNFTFNSMSKFSFFTINKCLNQLYF